MSYTFECDNCMGTTTSYTSFTLDGLEKNCALCGQEGCVDCINTDSSEGIVCHKCADKLDEGEVDNPV